MDPEKRFTCAQLSQHPYFDGFNNEFDREKKEQLKHLQREQQKALQQQAKHQSNLHMANSNQLAKPGNPGVSLSHLLFFFVRVENSRSLSTKLSFQCSLSLSRRDDRRVTFTSAHNERQFHFNARSLVSPLERVTNLRLSPRKHFQV